MTNTNQNYTLGTLCIYGRLRGDYIELYCRSMEDIAKRYAYKFSISRIIKEFLGNKGFCGVYKNEMIINVDRENKTIKIGLRENHGLYLGDTCHHVWAALCIEIFIQNLETQPPPSITTDTFTINRLPGVITFRETIMRFTGLQAHKYAECSTIIPPVFEDEIEYVGITLGREEHTTWPIFDGLYIKKAYLEELLGCTINDLYKFLPKAKIESPTSSVFMLYGNDCVCINGTTVAKKDFKQFSDIDIETFLVMVGKTDHVVKIHQIAHNTNNGKLIWMEMPSSGWYFKEDHVDVETLCILHAINVADGSQREKYRIIKKETNLIAERI